MRHLTAFLLLMILTVGAAAESLRGPLGPELVVTPVEAAESSEIGLETVVVVDLGGDHRFFDAIDLELTVPSAAAEHPGALSLYVLGPVNISERDGIVDVLGDELLRQPLVRGGKLFYQIVLREGASPDASPAVTRIGETMPPRAFPIAVSIVARMKGISDAIERAEFSLAVRPVTREKGAIDINYRRDDGTRYDAESARAPDFELLIDGREVPVENEYLLTPGLHRIRLRSERYQDQEVTVGVEQGRSVTVDLPLELALATVEYSAPRGSTVYIDGSALDTASGAFTVTPGEHTIVVLLGDYTVTRRFAAQEQRIYSISITMDIVVEEIK